MRKLIALLAIPLFTGTALAQTAPHNLPPATTLNSTDVIPLDQVSTASQGFTTRGFPASFLSILGAMPPGYSPCNNTGVTGPIVACPPITAKPPLGISGTVLNANTSAPDLDLFIGGAGNGTYTGTTNVGIGDFVLSALTSGNGNTGVGYSSLNALTIGVNNLGFGVNSLGSLTTGGGNVAVGPGTLGSVVGGQENTAVGDNALHSTTNNYSVAVGTSALYDATSGGANTAIGPSAGRGITTGSNNTILGGCSGLAAALSSSVVICDSNNNVRLDWGKTTAGVMTLNGPVVSTTTVQTKTIYSAAGTPLPTCNAAAEGTWASVSDATAPTYNGNYVSGGAIHVPVYCNSVAWTTH